MQASGDLVPGTYEELLREVEEARRIAREMETFYRIGLATCSVLDLDGVMKAIHSGLENLMDVETFYIALYDETKSMVRFEYFCERGEMVESFSRPIKSDEGLTEWIIENRAPVLLKDTSRELPALPRKVIPVGEIPRSVIGIPLIMKDKVIGVMSSQTYRGHYDENHLRILSTVGNQAAIAIENARLYEELKTKNRMLEESRAELLRINKLLDKELEEGRRMRQVAERLAITDPVTGLYNYRYFQDRLDEELERAQRYSRRFSLLMIDVDYFKNYNDTHGHQAGDAVLRMIARLISRNVRSTDIVARYGGEEFVVILVEADKEASIRVAEKIRSCVAEFRFPNQETQPNGNLTVSIGVANYPEDATTKRDLIELADMAMYRGKRAGGNKLYVA